ncbi:FecR family protein [Solitalea lacus]|uniref:FecR family protein n=1 Tax=Solitalea lacus TaxID=2911172 RepID=UPI001EDA577B|nr:FecR family protein [Solitalea lacus]UKJ07489.1 FecR domain-containing protein [Solitalea lacus]
MQLKDLYRLLGLTGNEPSPFSSEGHKAQVKAEIWSKINDARQQLGEFPSPKVVSINRKQLILVAASITFFSVLGLLVHRKLTKRNAIIEYVTYKTPKGQTQMLELPDKSVIWLNAATEVRIPQKFTQQRDVYLIDGEAFFEVTPNKEKPFVVHSNGIETKVLGTGFNVKSMKNLAEIKVAVLHGRVAVGNAQQTFDVITKNQSVTYNKQTGTAQTKEVNTDEVVAWRNGDVVLRMVSFDEIITAIEDVYNVDIEYNATQFTYCRNYIRFSYKQPLAQVLDMLKAIQGIDYSVNGKTIKITGGAKCK